MCRRWIGSGRFLVLLSVAAACGVRGGASSNPGSSAPAADPGTGPATVDPPRADPSGGGPAGLPAGPAVPVRPDQAPLVKIQDVLDADSLLGRRVRVAVMVIVGSFVDCLYS